MAHRILAAIAWRTTVGQSMLLHMYSEYARSAIVDLLLALVQLCVQDMALALDSQTEALDEGGEEADEYAQGYRYHVVPAMTGQ